MNGSQFRQDLRAGRRLYGTMVASPSPRWVPLLAGMPLDFVFIDTEHLPIDRHQLSWMCQAYRYAGLPPVVRIASPDPYAACQVLDGGACGLIAPYVETVAEVRALAGAVKRRPVKGAKLAAAVEGRARFEPELESYVAAHNQANSLIINIESVPAIEALDDILAVDGLDAVLIGPHDLSCSLGQPERYDTPEFEAAVVDIFRRARAAGVGAGIHTWMPVAREEAWCRAGANLLIHSSDIIATRDAISAEISALRTRMGDKKSSVDTGAGTV
ncbi:MAG TPA: aldolase/citrate lyase family protein [Opitutaceae bacterium]